MMKDFLKRRDKSIFLTLFITFVFLVSFYFYGENVWRLFNIPSGSFSDFSTILHSLKLYSQGLDPLEVYYINYPSIWWKSLYFFEVSYEYAKYIFIFIIFSFLIGLCLILPNANYSLLFAVFIGVLSPAVLLGIERGNIDLFMFFWIAVAITLIQKQNISQKYSLFACLSILIGFLLKLFPIFSWIIMLKLHHKKFVVYTIVMLIFCGFYTIFNFSEILLIHKNTPKPTGSVAYGMNVFQMTLDGSSEYKKFALFFKYLSYLSVFLIFCFSFLFKKKLLIRKNTINFDSFRAGASVYIGTFLLGNNYDYRLMFLLFTIPQLFLWITSSDHRFLSVISFLILGMIYFSLYELLLYKIIPSHLSFLLNEMATWFIFFSFVFLIIVTLPDFIKRIIFQNYKFVIRKIRFN